MFYMKKENIYRDVPYWHSIHEDIKFMYQASRDGTYVNEHLYKKYENKIDLTKIKTI